MRNLQEHVKKAICYQKVFWPFIVWINCSSDLKKFANSWPSVSNFKSFSRLLEQFFLTVGQNNFGNKIPLNTYLQWHLDCYCLLLKTFSIFVSCNYCFQMAYVCIFKILNFSCFWSWKSWSTKILYESLHVKSFEFVVFQ
jgi:hypothetical protein